MSKVCQLTGKQAQNGNNVSHSHRRSNRMFFANVRKVKAVVNGTPKTMHVCSRCLMSNAVERA